MPAESDEILDGLFYRYFELALSLTFYTKSSNSGIFRDIGTMGTSKGKKCLDAKMSAKELAGYEWKGMANVKCRAL